MPVFLICKIKIIIIRSENAIFVKPELSNASSLLVLPSKSQLSQTQEAMEKVECDLDLNVHF